MTCTRRGYRIGTWGLVACLAAASGCGGDDEPEEGDSCSGDQCLGQGTDYLVCGGNGKLKRVSDPLCECHDGKELCQ
ncbi:MAG: hypothetical protein JW940_08760 [Polyangiaceae bacterium]|nr:hypothetical protein [Polyangiaceae bacterium]